MNREELQEKFAEIGFRGKRGILKLSPRFGKTACGIKILGKIGLPKTLIVYPDNEIRKSWENEFERMEYPIDNITFSSNISLHKYIKEKWDVIIFDEINRLSERNIRIVEQEWSPGVIGAPNFLLGLTGSLTHKDEMVLRMRLKMPIQATYSQEEAIRDGIIADYEIRIVEVPLNNKKLIQYKKKLKTEKQQFDAYSFIIKKLQYEGKNTMFLALGRMRIIQGSIAKLEATKRLLEQFKDERVLVFCGLIKVADQLGIPVHHSKSADNLTEYLEGKGNHLALVKVANQGVTFKPLHKIIINYFNSASDNLVQQLHRATNLDFDNPSRKAIIYIISSSEPAEKQWLMKALKPFQKDKIKYI